MKRIVLLLLCLLLVPSTVVSAASTASFLNFCEVTEDTLYLYGKELPQGGSVTPGSMLPIMLFSASFGMGPGLIVGLAYGVLQYLQGGYFLNIWQFLLDYALAYAALGLTGIAKKLPQQWGLYAAMALAAIARALSATLAGYMFWDTALWPSLVYNGTYLIPDTLICMVLAAFIAKPVMRILKAK